MVVVGSDHRIKSHISSEICLHMTVMHAPIGIFVNVQFQDDLLLFFCCLERLLLWCVFALLWRVHAAVAAVSSAVFNHKRWCQAPVADTMILFHCWVQWKAEKATLASTCKTKTKTKTSERTSLFCCIA
eukprot:TRINITY_DN5849_c0_g1_i1.p2 TRINITY_DN5849_c0_g1~~TRINITY_DN5849_c0_g1_i1.p2  ORF type:complete len:129 (-),score=7.18 TRINITY_DN5849_c0_g1_i1:4-390(-)